MFHSLHPPPQCAGIIYSSHVSCTVNIYTHTHELEYNPPSVRKLCSHKLTVCPQVCFHNLLLEMNPRSPVRRVGKRWVSRSPRLSCLFMQVWCLWSHFGLGPNQGSSQGTQNLPPQRVPCHWAHWWPCLHHPVRSGGNLTSEPLG